MTATKQRPITFVSRIREQRLIMKAARPKRDGNGEFVGIEQGKTIEFTDSRYVTADPDEIEFLRGRMNAIDGPGLYELGVENAPAAEETLLELLKISSDHGLVRQLLERERSEYNRKAVVKACLNILGEDPDERQNPSLHEPPAPAPPDDPTEEAADDQQPAETFSVPENAAQPPSVIDIDGLSWPELQKYAKAQGVKASKKAEILAELKAKQA